MIRIPIESGAPYEVLIEDHILDQTGAYVREVCPGAEKAVIVSDSRVSGLYLSRVEESLKEAGYRTASFVFPEGEKSKCAETYLKLMGFLADEGMTRSDAVVALGGGVTGDMAGFAAATFMRGVPYVQIPTTLLAMTDSSVGGKTAIDLAQGKNLAGAFYQPRTVLCDPLVLDTLDQEVLRDGCAEVIKYGILADEELFSHLEEKGPGFDRERVISTCVRIKADYVREDEFDSGRRQELNLGHTIGHAVEALSGFSITHGCAVAIGTAMIADASCKKNILSSAERDRIRGLLEKFGLPVRTDRTKEELISFMLSDKKRRGDRITLVVPETVGRCRLEPVQTDELGDWIVK